jgi:TonB family protein
MRNPSSKFFSSSKFIPLSLIYIFLLCLNINETIGQESAENEYIKIINQLKNGNFEITELTNDSVLLFKGRLSSVDPDVRSGRFYFFHDSGTLSAFGEYEQDFPIGNWIYFDESGDTIFSTNYSDVLQFLITEESEYTMSGNEFYNAETLAKFNGGDPSFEFTNYLRNNLIYPEYTRLLGLTGVVIIQFAVDTLGRVRNPQIVRPAGLDFNMEALRVVCESPKWEPGLIHGEPVEMLFTWPIAFPPDDQSKAGVISPKAFDFRSPLKTKTSKLDISPRFMGKDPAISFARYIAENLKYPSSAAQMGVKGRVLIQFTVNEDGLVSQVSIVDGAARSLNKEAIRVVESSPKWTPGFSKGKPVPVQYTYPINFIIND